MPVSEMLVYFFRMDKNILSDYYHYPLKLLPFYFCISKLS